MAFFETIPQAFDQIADRYPAKAAVVYLGTSYSYARLREWSDRFAGSLRQMRVKVGDRVVLYLPNSPQWIVSWLGVLKAGGVAVPVTPIYASPDLRYVVRNSGARAIVCTDTNFGYVKQVLPGSPLERVVVTNVVDLLPAWKRLFGWAFNKVPKGKVPREAHTYPLRKLLSAGSSPAAQQGGRGEQIAEILYTGGTTRHPKGVPISHRLFLECTAEQIRISEPLFPMEENVILSGAPLFHILGQTCGLGTCIVGGGTLLLQPRVNLDGMLEAIQRFRARTLIGVPALYRMILEHERIDLYDLSSLRYCFSAGDVLPGEIGKRWQERFGKPIFQGYGATETCGGVAMSPVAGELRLKSMGRVLPGKKIMVVSPDTMGPVAAGEAGELLVSSESMVTGYWDQTEETAVSFVELHGRVWYRTGDIVTADEDGFLYFVDRTVDTIKHKGYRVSASEIESVLQDHPAVVGACVVGVPDSEVGERIKAFVVLKKDMKGITGYDLIRWCRERLTSYKVPQYVEFRDMLPKSKVGKLLRREIRSEEKKRFALS